jgi:hypothetical protein
MMGEQSGTPGLSDLEQPCRAPIFSGGTGQRRRSEHDQGVSRPAVRVVAVPSQSLRRVSDEVSAR